MLLRKQIMARHWRCREAGRAVNRMLPAAGTCLASGFLYGVPRRLCGTPSAASLGEITTEEIPLDVNDSKTLSIVSLALMTRLNTNAWYFLFRTGRQLHYDWVT
jgi:hypothetical protein